MNNPLISYHPKAEMTVKVQRRTVMEPVIASKEAKESKIAPKTKPARTYGFAAIRVKKETRKRLMAELAKANRKDYGRRVHADELVELLVTLIKTEHIVKLQEGSFSHKDRLNKEHRDYVAAHGPISMDEYLGKRLSGAITGPEAAKQASGQT